MSFNKCIASATKTTGKEKIDYLIKTNNACSSLVEGDEQLNWPNSQTTMELCHADVA